MSLLAWYPLNGNQHNFGLKEAELTWTTTPTFVDGGKFGKCMSTGAGYWTAAQTANILTYKFSLCLWMKVINTDTHEMIFGNSGMGGAGNSNNRHYSLFQYSTANDLHYYWLNDATSSAMGAMALGATKSGFFPTGEWVHLAVTYGDGYFKIYRNGTLYYKEATTAFNPSSFAYQTNVLSNSTSSYKTDLRIYNHVLSLKEVLDISRGLVVHYKLDNLSGRSGNPNLLTNSQSYVYSGSASTATINFKQWSGLSLKTSTNYTLSFDAYIDTTDDTICQGLCRDLYPDDMPLSNILFNSTGITNKKKKFTWTFSSTSTNMSNATLRLFIDFANSDGKKFLGYPLHIENIKLEEDSKATDWCPHTSDTLYTSLGYTQNTVSDCSGLLNSATIVNSPVISSDSKIYDACVNTNYTGYIKNTALNLVTSSISISFWFNPKQESSKMQHFLLGTFNSWTNNGIGIWTNDNTATTRTYLLLVKGDSATQYTSMTINTKFTCGSWYHFVMTYDGANIKVYVNGTLSDVNLNGTITNTVAYAGGTITNPNIYIGNSMYNDSKSSETENVMISDFRIYSTALDTDAVRQLYQVHQCLDKKYNLYTYNYYEVLNGNPSFLKNGLANSLSYNENNLLYDENIYKEPDGSCWVRIFHHSNPTGSKFSSTDTFTTSVYKDSDRWFNIAYCDNCTDNGKWELMVKQKPTSDGSESKYRWIQYVNPMTATYDETSASKITKNTSSEYAEMASAYGGLYKGTLGYAYLTGNQGNAGWWWGALGSWTSYNNGIPGFANVLVTTGYIDLYIRMIPANISKNGMTSGLSLIEL